MTNNNKKWYLLKIKSGDSKLFIPFKNIDDTSNSLTEKDLRDFYRKNSSETEGCCFFILFLAFFLSFIAASLCPESRYIRCAVSLGTYLLITVPLISLVKKYERISTISVSIPPFIFSKLKIKDKYRIEELIDLLLTTGNFKMGGRRVLQKLLKSREVKVVG